MSERAHRSLRVAALFVLAVAALWPRHPDRRALDAAPVAGAELRTPRVAYPGGAGELRLTN